jgi:hypothetical protein
MDATLSVDPPDEASGRQPRWRRLGLGGLPAAMVVAAVVMFASVACVLVSPLVRIRQIDASAPPSG